MNGLLYVPWQALQSCESLGRATVAATTLLKTPQSRLWHMIFDNAFPFRETFCHPMSLAKQGLAHQPHLLAGFWIGMSGGNPAHACE
jgi:hypothetical protein